MKNNLIKIIYYFTLLTFISSCSKSPDKILPKKDGKFIATVTHTDLGSGNVSTSIGNFTFLDSGAGTILVGNTVTNFTWSYDKKTKQISLTYNGSLILVYDVSEMKSKSEKWTAFSVTHSSIGTVLYGSGTGTGYNNETETIILEKTE